MDRITAHRLVCRAQKGQTAARNELIAYYCETLVPPLAWKWTRVDFDDAKGVGNLAVVEAVDAAVKSYDPEQESGIAPYVRMAVVQALSAAHQQATTVHAPTKRTAKVRQVPLGAIAEPTDPAPSPEALTMRQDRQERIQQLFTECFSARDADVLRALYFEDMSVGAVAARFAVSESLVYHIRSNAIHRLQAHPELRVLLA